MWKKIDVDLIENPPARLTTADQCYHAREYTSGKSYDHSETNRLVSNLKMGIEHRGAKRWYYKERAIAQFASELASVLSDLNFRYILAPVPSSKRLDDPAYDGRLDAVITQVCRRCPHAVSARPVVRQTTIRAAHTSRQNRPTPSEVAASLAWDDITNPTEVIIFIDDVVTTGTTFKQCQALVNANEPDMEVFGMFWARTVWE